MRKKKTKKIILWIFWHIASALSIYVVGYYHDYRWWMPSVPLLPAVRKILHGRDESREGRKEEGVEMEEGWRGVHSVYEFSFICVPSSFLQPNLRLIHMGDITNRRSWARYTFGWPGLQAFLMYRVTASTAVPLHADLPRRSCGALVGSLVTPSPTALMIVTWACLELQCAYRQEGRPHSICLTVGYFYNRVLISTRGIISPAHPAVAMRVRLL